MKISAHVLIKNEENFIWFAINSILDYVDEVLVWDNGSKDKTVSIIESIKSSKIKFRDVSKIRFEKARQEMIDDTKADWIFLLDGDEIWHDAAISNIKDQILKVGDKKDCIVVSNYMLVGDMFHYQEEKAGRYKIGGKVGHYNVRAVRNFPGLHIEGVYGNEGFVNRDGVKVQNLPKERVLFLNIPYLHASFLRRTSKGKRKKFEMGEEFPYDFYYPEVFFRPRPEIVPSVWESMGFSFKPRAFFETPLKKIYRRTFLPFRKHGY